MLSYMSRGCALSWVEQKLEEVVAPGIEVVWDTFVASLCEAFGDSDHAMMACLFKDGLSLHILSCIYRLATMPTTLHEWKEKAWQFHYQYLELQQCQKAGLSLPGQHQVPPQTSSGSQGAHQTTPTSVPIKQEPRDGAVHQGSGTCTYYMCGSPDHFACECLQCQVASRGD
jgi:hypothetical protein